MSEELATKLKTARQKLELTQKQFAETIGAHPKALREWEQNRRTPRGFALTALMEKLDAILSED